MKDCIYLKNVIAQRFSNKWVSSGKYHSGRSAKYPSTTAVTSSFNPKRLSLNLAIDESQRELNLANRLNVRINHITDTLILASLKKVCVLGIVLIEGSFFSLIIRV